MGSNPTNLQVNISSLMGRLSLNRTENALQTSIRNLSSGIRIYTAKDDPVGFVSSTAMQTDILSTKQAIENCERADAVIATADSALKHVDNLLIDLRGLLTQAANTGAENPATLASLQLQADAILQQIDYISLSTTFQGQSLLDGSLDFTTYPNTNQSAAGLITKLGINQANFLGRTEKDIAIQVIEPPRQATLYYPYGALKQDTTFALGGTKGYNTFSFDADATVYDIADAVNRFSDSTGVGAAVYSQPTPGNLVLTSFGINNDIAVIASKTGEAAGNFVFRFTKPESQNEEAFVNFTEGNGNNPAVVEVVLRTDAQGNILSTANEIADLLNTSPLLKDAGNNSRISASIPASQTGEGIVTPFKESAYYGSISNNNFLQFLAPEGSPNIRLATGQPGEPMSVKLSDDKKTLLFNLETDSNGLVKTTANDLVRFFDNPPNEETKKLLTQYGISVTSIDPSNPNLPCATDSPSGLGRLVPTYDPLDECPVEGYYPDIEFSSYGENIVEDYASGTVLGKRSDADFTITATQKGAAYNNTQINIIDDADGPKVNYDPVLKRLVIGIKPNTDTSAQQIVDLVNNDEEVKKYFTASLPAGTTGAGFVTANSRVTMTGGIKDCLDSVEVPAELGVRMFSGTDWEQLGLTFFSTEFGSSEFVDFETLYAEDFPTTDSTGNVVNRSYGKDVVAYINGQRAIGDGRIAKSSTSELDVNIWIDPNVQSGDVFGFRITGGGTLIQLGQNPVSEMQARLGIPSVHTAHLGGVNGVLADLKTGGSASLLTNTGKAYQIVNEVTEEIASLRGRLGAFQKNRLEPNINTMLDSIEIETGARSKIADTDFAAEASNLSRQQLLMQSNIAVLGQIQSTQQLLLSLLQG
ncbi:hypothetical protein FACS189419_04610 [Planctomycetales bacterium]|nr:hypothetical protein FACS189419_04610 [Planctomycetales bacterium]